MATRCRRCGLPKRRDPAAGWRRAVGLRGRPVCPACGTHRPAVVRDVTLVLLLLVVWVGTGVCLVVGYPSEVAGWALLNLALLFALCPLLIVPHEAGHALAAAVLGFRIFRVEAGYQGPILLAFRRWGVRFELRTDVDMGVTEFASPCARLLRLRYWLAVLAGPLTNAALFAAATAWWVPRDLQRLRQPGAAVWLTPGPAFAVANALHLLNLLPFTRRGLRSDGLQLLSIPFWSPATVVGVNAGYFLSEGNAYLLAGRAADALPWYEQAGRLCPGDPNVALAVGSALLRAGNPKRAWEHYQLLSLRLDVPAGVRARGADGAATALLLLARGPGEAGLLAQAEAFCREAMREEKEVDRPTRLSFRATWGAVLVAQGRVDEGVAVLDEVLPRLRTTEEKAIVLCYLSAAAARKGEAAAAAEYRDAARRLDATCRFLSAADGAAVAPAG